MVPSFPLFPGIPGGPELLIVLVVMVIVLGVPTLLVAAAAFFGLRYFRGGDTREERIEELEREVERLRRNVGADRTASDEPVTGRSGADGDVDAGGKIDGDFDGDIDADDDFAGREQ